MKNLRPLSKHALAVLDRLGAAPVPTSDVNPGVVDRLCRGGLVVIVYLPSPYATRRGALVPHLKLKT